MLYECVCPTETDKQIIEIPSQVQEFHCWWGHELPVNVSLTFSFFLGSRCVLIDKFFLEYVEQAMFCHFLHPINEALFCSPELELLAHCRRVLWLTRKVLSVTCNLLHHTLSYIRKTQEFLVYLLVNNYHYICKSLLMTMILKNFAKMLYEETSLYC